MKDLDPTNQILCMKIVCDKKAKKLWLSQENYVEWVIKQFNMKNAKPACTPLVNHFKLIKSFCPSSRKETKKMTTIPSSSAVGSLIYVMVCTGPDISHAICIVRRFLSNPEKDHWEVLKYLKGIEDVLVFYGS